MSSLIETLMRRIKADLSDLFLSVFFNQCTSVTICVISVSIHPLYEIRHRLSGFVHFFFNARCNPLQERVLAWHGCCYTA